MFYNIFLSRQVKQCAIITYKHGIYEVYGYFINLAIKFAVKKENESVM